MKLLCSTNVCLKDIFILSISNMSIGVSAGLLVKCVCSGDKGVGQTSDICIFWLALKKFLAICPIPNVLPLNHMCKKQFSGSATTKQKFRKMCSCIVCVVAIIWSCSKSTESAARWVAQCFNMLLLLWPWLVCAEPTQSERMVLPPGFLYTLLEGVQHE